MSKTRVYVPSTLTRLQEVLVSGGIGPLPVLAHTVTDALRLEYADGGDEEWEYAALTAAAQDSLGLLTEDDPQRRVVIAVDTETVLDVDRAETSLVELEEVIPARGIAAVHVDDADAEATVAMARAAWVDAQNGDRTAAALVEECLDHELGWFAAQEIGDLLED